MSLQRTLLALIMLAVLVGTVPTGIVLDRWVASALEARARDDISMAPAIAQDRSKRLETGARVDEPTTAETLAGLTRSDVILVASNDSVVATTMKDSVAHTIAASITHVASPDSVTEIRMAGSRYLVTMAPVASNETAIFVRDLGRDLALIPRLRRVLVGSGLMALVLALILGALVTKRVAAIAEQSARLSMEQAQLMQQDRLAATGHLVVQLAHEIRNPVANIRNCLELIRRHVDAHEQARGFVDLAVEELMRMHTLAEQLLDLNRPRDAKGAWCNAATVVGDVMTLVTLDGITQVTLNNTSDDARARISADALKQVLLNLARNAVEAAGSSPTHIAFAVDKALRDDVSIVIVDVIDDGPGIPEPLLPRIFDPFVTTKRAVHGVGLGLFVAEGLVRSAGGRMTAWNRSPETGAVFRVELPGADAPA